MRPLEDAQRDVLSALPALPVVAVPLWQAHGLALAGLLRAPHDVPPFTNSAMDGFAVRGTDVASAPVTLSVLEDVAAGHVAAGRVEEGSAIKIMTGAPLPEGADTIVRVEDTSQAGTEVQVLVPTPVGTSVRPAGGDVEKGAEVFEEGERLTPAHLAVLASLGAAEPLVRRRPRVAIISTGDEVQPPETGSLEPGQIRDTNRPLLTGLLGELGADVLDLGIVPDDAGRLRATIERAADEADAIFTSGGVSMGEYDLVKQVLAELGDIEFWKVAMQPAKPFAFGLVGGTPLFGLPGNPVSVMVAFEQFARPGLLHMMGAARLFRPRVAGLLETGVRTDPEKTVFLRASAHWDGAGWLARLSGGQSSNVLSALARGNCFAVVPRGQDAVEPGDSVALEMFGWPESRTLEEAIGVG